MTIKEFNKLSREEAAGYLFTCCGAEQWVSHMLTGFPFTGEKQLVSLAETSWYNKCNESDWLLAFEQHPKIGDVKGLTEKFATTKHLAGNEQSGVHTASVTVIEQLAKANAAYESTFGFIFIVCATGRSADEMLRLLENRLSNSREEELAIAMGEQHKISIIRLMKMINGGDWGFMPVSQLTSHVLDTSQGKPARHISIKLKKLSNGNWISFAQGMTNNDGRVTDLLPPALILHPGNYTIVFDTGGYFRDLGIAGFYPEVAIQFIITDNSHYHIPLLINPFGYSTYRGS
jgi:5-hydroxyisourate hydrolase/2-oxo-4-hydroxy-4-carboxy-5-ureidoimidazoline decarboxylase